MRYSGKEWLTIQEANLDKEILYRDFFPNADVFILPSYQDSFGLVFLEALSFGLPIIATDIYAVPEMVYDEINGYLIEPPILFFNKDYTLNEKSAFSDLSIIIENDGIYNGAVQRLIHKIKDLIDNDRIRDLSLQSKILFERRFSEECHSRDFLRALQ